MSERSEEIGLMFQDIIDSNIIIKGIANLTFLTIAVSY